MKARDTSDEGTPKKMAKELFLKTFFGKPRALKSSPNLS
jgi:hypothetical protein